MHTRARTHHTYTQKQAHKHTSTRGTHAHAHTHTHALARTHTRTHAHAHARTHAPALAAGRRDGRGRPAARAHVLLRGVPARALLSGRSDEGREVSKLNHLRARAQRVLRAPLARICIVITTATTARVNQCLHSSNSKSTN